MIPVNSTTSCTPASLPKADKGTLYKMANKFFKAPASVDSWTKNGMAKEDAFLGKTRRWTREFVGNRLKELVDYDYREFPALVLGKHHIPLAEPPKGALLLLLYPGTVIPRLYRAYQRGKQNNDYREMGDVLRRDMTAITLFVFALGPVVRHLSALTEKLSGVKLLDPNSKQVLKYSQFKNYEIDSKQALKAILTEGNGDALVAAVNKLHDRGLSSKYKVHELDNAINGESGIKKTVTDLVEAFKKHNGEGSGRQIIESPVWNGSVDGLADKAFASITEAEKLREAALTKAKAGGSAEMVKVAEKMRGEFKGVLQNSAKAHRLPSDLVSFAILVGAIGYLPMWINTEWNKRQFEKKMAAKAEAEKNKQAPQPAAKTQQSAALVNHQAPVLPQPPAFAQGPAFGTFGQIAPQPFSTLNRQMPNNPFNRQG